MIFAAMRRVTLPTVQPEEAVQAEIKHQFALTDDNYTTIYTKMEARKQTKIRNSHIEIVTGIQML